MTLLLGKLGHEVIGFSLKPNNRDLYVKAEIEDCVKHSQFGDIRDLESLDAFVKKHNPDFIFHFAAQSLVLQSYLDPMDTFSTNVAGTYNLLQASKSASNLKGLMIITTDKVYSQVGETRAFTEEDPLGGNDPYSASKAAADIIAQSFAKSLAQVPVGIARAGNVIGGGDWAKDRLLPDIALALKSDVPISIRNLDAVRPWQHVLDCLDGYIRFMDHLMATEEKLTILNFGPQSSDFWTVSEVLSYINREILGDKLKVMQQMNLVGESKFLILDSTKARNLLSWSNVFSTPAALTQTIHWYLKFMENGNARELALEDIDSFLALRAN